MKYILFLLIINFLTIQCPAEFLFFNQLRSFLSIFGIRSNSSQYEELQSDDLDVEPGEPLYLLLINLDGETTGIVSNPIFLGQYTKTEEFVDFLIACPKKDQKQNTAKIKTENRSETQTLVIENSYTSLLKNYEKQTNTFEEETYRTDTANIQYREEPKKKNDEILNDSIPESKWYWRRAIEAVNNFKCDGPIRAQLIEHSSSPSIKVYTVGFEIFGDKIESLKLPKYKIFSDPKYAWLQSFAIIFSNFNSNVFCVFQEVHYNKDTYRPEINDNFNNHDFGSKEMFPEMDIGQLYEIKNQEKIFGKLFVNKEERKKYFDIDQGQFFVRVHLAPLHNFLSPVIRQSGKTYGNVAPMWNSIRNAAWRRVEDYIDILSNVLSELIVITGTYGTLNLDGKSVYLADDNKIPVPLAFWKIVIYGTDTNNSYGIFITTYNNPYQNIDDIICEKNSCQEYGWGYIQEDNINRGRTTCCELTLKILNDLQIANAVFATKILNLFELSSIVNNLWEYNELGEKTTSEARDAILDKLQLNEIRR